MQSINLNTQKHLYHIFISVIFLLPIVFYTHRIITVSYFNSDFRSFYPQAKILLQQPQKLYNLTTQEIYQKRYLHPQAQFKEGPLLFANPPFFLLPYLPFTLVPITIAYYLTVLSLIILLIINISFLLKLFPIKNRLLPVLFSISFPAVYSTISYTQSSLVTLLIFSTTFYLLQQQKLLLAGLISSLLLYKPQLGIILWIYLFVQKQKPIYIGFTIGLITLTLLSLNLLKGELSTIIDLILLFLHPQYGLTWTTKISWLGFFVQLSQYIPELNIQLWSYTLSLLTVIFGTWQVKKIKFSSPHLPLAFSIIILSTLLSGLHINFYEGVLLLFPYFYFFLKYHHSLKLQLITISGWCLSFFTSFGINTTEPIYFIPTIYLFLLLILITRQAKSNTVNY